MPGSASRRSASARAIASVTSFSRVPCGRSPRVLAAVAGVDRDDDVTVPFARCVHRAHWLRILRPGRKRRLRAEAEQQAVRVRSRSTRYVPRALSSAALPPQRAARLAAEAHAGDDAEVSGGKGAGPMRVLEHPDRLVIDLQHTHRASALRPPLPSGVVTGVRFGSQPGGTLRVVVQLNSALVARTAWSGSARHRLLFSLGTKPALAPGPEDAQPVRAVHAPGEGDRDVIIAVDAGHGARTRGDRTAARARRT